MLIEDVNYLYEKLKYDKRYIDNIIYAYTSHCKLPRVQIKYHSCCQDGQ